MLCYGYLRRMRSETTACCSDQGLPMHLSQPSSCLFRCEPIVWSATSTTTTTTTAAGLSMRMMMLMDDDDDI